jgi:hypothetical protein
MKNRDVFVIGVKTPAALHAECIDKVRPDDSMSDLDVMQWSLRRRVDAMTKTPADCDALLAFAERQGSSPAYVYAVAKVLASFDSGDRNAALNGLRNVLLGTDVPRFAFEDGRVETASGHHVTEPVINASPHSLLVQTHGNCFVHAAVNCALNCPPLARLLAEEVAAACAKDTDYYDGDAFIDEFRDVFSNADAADEIVARFRSKDKREFQATRRAILLGILTSSTMPAKMSPELEQLYDAMAVTRKQAQKRKTPLAEFTEGGSPASVLARILSTAGAALDFYGKARCGDCFPPTCVGTFKSGARVFLDTRDGLPEPGEAGLLTATFGQEGHAVAFLPGFAVNSNLTAPLLATDYADFRDVVMEGAVAGRDYQEGVVPEFERTRVYVSNAQQGGALAFATRAASVAARSRPYRAVVRRPGVSSAVDFDEVPEWPQSDDLVLEEVLEFGQLAVIGAAVCGAEGQRGGSSISRTAVQIALAAVVLLASVFAA